MAGIDSQLKVVVLNLAMAGAQDKAADLAMAVVLAMVVALAMIVALAMVVDLERTVALAGIGAQVKVVVLNLALAVS